MRYQLVDQLQAEDIAKLAVCLTHEIIERTGIQHFDVDVSRAIELCEKYMANGVYEVIAAFDEGKVIAFGAVCASHSLYAEGAFGIVQEFYVMPEYRSQKVGAGLLRAIKQLSKERAWKRLELCTPPVPEFDRTVDFY